MKVHLITSSSINKQTQERQQYVSSISHELSQHGSLQGTYAGADLVYVVGPLDLHVVNKIRKADSISIPILYSPLGALTPWCHQSYHNILKAISVFYAIGGATERKYIERRYRSRHIYHIVNPIVSNQLGYQNFHTQINEVYKNVAQEHDLLIQAEIKRQIDNLSIDQQEITYLCRQFLYAKYLYDRSYLYQQFIDNLSADMLKSDYDEDLMASTITHLKLYDFVSSLEGVMLKSTSLTEGFIPIPAVENRLTQRITNVIELQNQTI